MNIPNALRPLLHPLQRSVNIILIIERRISSESSRSSLCTSRMNAFASRNIKAAVKYLHGAQRPEGGWFGSWGICFTYATQFALESLALVGETYATSERVRKACRFLLSKQREDGGWGESFQVSPLFERIVFEFFICISRHARMSLG